jgi:hypothetical protein
VFVKKEKKKRRKGKRKGKGGRRKEKKKEKKKKRNIFRVQRCALCVRPPSLRGYSSGVLFECPCLSDIMPFGCPCPLLASPLQSR